MKTHELAEILLERPDGEVTISLDVSEDGRDFGLRAFSQAYLGIQPDTNPEDTVLLFEGITNF